jgi:hypothetical protein
MRLARCSGPNALPGGRPPGAPARPPSTPGGAGRGEAGRTARASPHPRVSDAGEGIGGGLVSGPAGMAEREWGRGGGGFRLAGAMVSVRRLQAVAKQLSIAAGSAGFFRSSWANLRPTALQRRGTRDSDPVPRKLRSCRWDELEAPRQSRNQIPANFALKAWKSKASSGQGSAASGPYRRPLIMAAGGDGRAGPRGPGQRAAGRRRSGRDCAGQVGPVGPGQAGWAGWGWAVTWASSGGASGPRNGGAMAACPHGRPGNCSSRPTRIPCARLRRS